MVDIVKILPYLNILSYLVTLYREAGSSRKLSSSWGQGWSLARLWIKCSKMSHVGSFLLRLSHVESFLLKLSHVELTCIKCSRPFLLDSSTLALVFLIRLGGNSERGPRPSFLACLLREWKAEYLLSAR